MGDRSTILSGHFLNHTILTARQYAWITLAFTIFVIYGSLVPLTFQPVPFDRAWSRFMHAFKKPITVSNRSDWLANVLLFIPLGFVAMGWLSVDRSDARIWPRILRKTLVMASLLIGFALLSALLEFAQIWFPPRDTSINDVAAETIGGAIGITIWLGSGESITNYARRFWNVHGEGNWAIRLIPAYLVILAIAQGMPFDLTLNPSDLGRKYRRGHVLPIPFTLKGREPLDLVRKGLINFAYFLPAGVLIAGLPGKIATGRYAALRVLAIGILLAGAIEAMQLIVITRFSDATDILTGSLAVLVGWRLMRYFLTEKNAWRSRQARTALFLAWVAALVFINWEPFDFAADAGFISQRWQEMSFVPFADYYAGNYLMSFSAMLDKTLLFVPFSLFLAAATNIGGPWRVVASACLFAVLLETGQFFLRHHTPGVSDLILEPAGAWFGCLIAPKLRMMALAGPEKQALPAGLAVRS
jgi:glycopeptide antibiotics resistance protein